QRRPPRPTRFPSTTLFRSSLSEQVQAALAGSASLIVVCSPAARQSPWVSREVELFRSLHPDRPVLAALIAGSPADAFPEPLLDSDRKSTRLNSSHVKISYA